MADVPDTSRPARVTVPLDLANDRGAQGIISRLTDEREAIERLERQLKWHKRNRRALVLKALRKGMTTRHIGAIAGLSSRGVSHIGQMTDEEFAAEWRHES
jgi:hypothetical protein